jgi:hypothetical protein
MSYAPSVAAVISVMDTLKKYQLEESEKSKVESEKSKVESEGKEAAK